TVSPNLSPGCPTRGTIPRASDRPPPFWGGWASAPGEPPAAALPSLLRPRAGAGRGAWPPPAQPSWTRSWPSCRLLPRPGAAVRPVGGQVGPHRLDDADLDQLALLFGRGQRQRVFPVNRPLEEQPGGRFHPGRVAHRRMAATVERLKGRAADGH